MSVPLCLRCGPRPAEERRRSGSSGGPPPPEAAVRAALSEPQHPGIVVLRVVGKDCRRHAGGLTRWLAAVRAARYFPPPEQAVRNGMGVRALRGLRAKNGLRIFIFRPDVVSLHPRDGMRGECGKI